MRAALKSSDEGAYFEPTRFTMGEWLNIWLKEYAEPSLKTLSLSTYESCIRTNIKPALAS